MSNEIIFDEQFPEIDFAEVDAATAPRQNNAKVKLANSILAAAATDGDVAGLLSQIESGVDINSYLQEQARGALIKVDNAVVTNAVAEGRGQLTQEEYDAQRGAYRFGELLTPSATIINSNSTEGESHRTAFPRFMSFELAAQNRIPDTSERGVLSGVGSFLGRVGESIITDPIQAIGGLMDSGDTFEGAGDLVALADSVRTAAFDYNMTDEEFALLVTDTLDRVDDYGFFSDDNPHMIGRFMDMVYQGGWGNQAIIMGAEQAVSVVAEAAAPTVVPVARVALGTLRASASVVTSHAVASMYSRMAGIKVGAQGAAAAPRSSSTLQTVLPNIMLPGAKLSASSINHPVLQSIEHSSRALETVSRINVGVPYEEVALKAAAADLAKKTSQGLGVQGNRLGNVAHGTDKFGNPALVYTLGKEGGAGFVARARAQQVADDLGGSVVPAMEDGKTKWFVYNEVNIPTRGLPKATEMLEVASAGKFMSTAFRTTQYLNNILKTGEAGGASLMEKVLPSYWKALGKTTKEERDKFDDLYRAYNEEPRFQMDADVPLTRSEFVRDYTRLHGESPSNNLIKLWAESEEVGNADYFLRADKEFKNAVGNGEVMVRMPGDDFVRGRPHAKPDTKYWDAETKTYMSADDAAANGYTTMKINSSNYFDNGLLSTDGKRLQVQHVAIKGPTTRRVTHPDVLPYNRGAHRMYESKGGWFLRQATKHNTANGVKAGIPRTFMHVKTLTQAKKAEKEFGVLFQGTRAGTLTDDIVRANTSWNPDIETVAEFDAFVTRHNLDITEDVAQSLDGDLTKFLPDQSFSGYSTESNAFIQLSAQNRKRGLSPLHGYGTGGAAETINFSDMLPKAFMNSATTYAYAAYNQAATEGLIKAARASGHLGNEAVVMDALNRGQNLRAIEEVAKGLSKNIADPDVQKILSEAATIKTALGNEQPINKAIERMQHRMVEWAAAKDMPKVQTSLEWFNGKTGATQASNFLRSTAFNMKLGLFAVDQFWVQSSAVFMSGIMASTNIGLNGAMQTFAHLPAVRIFLQSPDSLRPALAIKMHKAAGFDTADELIEWGLHLEYSGRLAVKGTAGEENVARSAVSGVTQRVSDAGLVPFNEGEKINRLYSMMLAREEAKKTYGAAFSLSDKRIAQEMIGRSDILTQSMTNASSAAFQKDAVAIPFQFLTYTRNVSEQIFTNKIISAAERRRMAMGQLVMYGAAGVPGMGYLVDKFAWANDMDPPTMVRYGALDTAVGLLTGVDTSISTRLGAGEGLFDLIRGLKEDPLYEVFGGPGVAIGGDSLTAIIKLAKSVASPDMKGITSAEYLAVINNLSSASRVVKSMVAYRTGEYISSRSGRTVVEGLDSGDAIATALGIPLQEVNELYRYSNFAYAEKEALKETENDIRRYMRSWDEAYEVRDFEKMKVISNTINVIQSSLTPLQKENLGSIFNTDTTQDKFVKMLIDIGKLNLAGQVENRGNN